MLAYLKHRPVPWKILYFEDVKKHRFALLEIMGYIYTQGERPLFEIG
jgi:hypothetical protein